MLKFSRYEELKLAKQETRICLKQSNFYTLIISLFVFLVTYPILNNLNSVSCHSTKPKHQYTIANNGNKNHHANRQQRAVYMAIDNQSPTRIHSSESLASSWFYQQDQPAILDQCCACDEAKYELVFEGLWSKYTHPDDFPENYWLAYFSDIIGASHSNDFRMWAQGSFASEGVRELAETGATKKLESELKQVSSKTRTIIKARELRYPTLNSKTSAVFRTDKHHHLVSVLSKLGPSPDWMVGVSGLELCQLDCTWAAQRIVNLYLWDAGTDSGSTFTSADNPTRPQERIHSYRRSSAAQLSSQTNATMRSMFDPSNNNFDQVLSQFKHQQQQQQPSDQSGSNLAEMQTTSSDASSSMQSSNLNGNNNNNNNPTTMDSFNNEYIKPFARLTVTRQRIYEKSCNGGDPASTHSPSKSPHSVTTFNQNQHQHQHSHHNQQAHNSQQSHYRQTLDTELAPQEQTMRPANGGGGGGTVSYSDCRFTEWSDWSSCSSTCGKGIRTRTRSNLDDQADLAGCSRADLIEKEICLSECVANTTCVTRDWSEWSKCSVDCGQGYRKRTRSPIGQLRQACGNSVELVEMEQCTGSCGQDEQPASHCAVTEWSEWSECPVACGTGTKIRFRQFVRKEDADNCNVKLIQKQSCTGRPELCNQVSKDRRPTPATSNNAQSSHSYQGKINPDLPVIDCKLSNWSPWSTCSAMCGNGRRTRSRYVIQMPQNGGKPCDKKLTRTQRCKDLPPCPQDYPSSGSASEESHANRNNNHNNNNQHNGQQQQQQQHHHHHHHRVSQTKNEFYKTTTTTTTPSGSMMDDEDESKFSRLLKSDLGHLQLQTSWTPTESYISDVAATSTEMELIGSSSFQMKNGYIYPFNYRERIKQLVV